MQNQHKPKATLAAATTMADRALFKLKRFAGDVRRELKKPLILIAAIAVGLGGIAAYQGWFKRGGVIPSLVSNEVCKNGRLFEKTPKGGLKRKLDERRRGIRC